MTDLADNPKEITQSHLKNSKRLRIATRKSKLALWQSNFVKEQLLYAFPDLDIELVTFETEGDKRLDIALNEIGGKGLFMKELEEAILADKADIAVHSLKDVPYQLPEGFMLGAFLKRDNPFDAFVSNNYHSIDNLPKGAIIGTSSLRRKAQLLKYRPDLVIKPIRGNVNTRLNKLNNGEYDALILASVGLKRLGLSDLIKEELKPQLMLPAQGQGIIAVELLSTNTEVHHYLKAINHRATEAITLAERTCNQKLEGSCHAPIGIYAKEEGENLYLRGIILSEDGKVAIKAESLGHDPIQLGKFVAEKLLQQGAKKLLN